jgi:hypothetical protein
LKKGWNWLQFSWVDTLIDPTSLALEPLGHRDAIDIEALVFPPRTGQLARWRIFSEVSGQVPVEISYLTSGLSWRAFYMGTLTPDEKSMRLQGYVRVSNNSGEDYENARTRLIVGKVHILDRIADLARRQYPYGRPGREGKDFSEQEISEEKADYGNEIFSGYAATDAVRTIKEVKKEGLSEYFLYTIEGTETIPHRWSKRLPSFEAGEVPVVNLYKYEEERYGQSVIRFLSFRNDRGHKLGETPIPGGMLKVYRQVDDAGHLSYEGQSGFKYIPVAQDVELNLGSVANVTVKTTLMDFKTDHYLFDRHGNVSGWDEIRTFRMAINNTRAVPVKVEIRRNFPTTPWSLEKSGAYGKYEKVDLDTVKFIQKLAVRSKKEFTYVLTTKHGKRAE